MCAASSNRKTKNLQRQHETTENSKWPTSMSEKRQHFLLFSPLGRQPTYTTIIAQPEYGYKGTMVICGLQSIAMFWGGWVSWVHGYTWNANTFQLWWQNITAKLDVVKPAVENVANAEFPTQFSLTWFWNEQWKIFLISRRVELVPSMSCLN